MIKWLAVLLIVANGVFWAWTQGWLGATSAPPGARQREPERLQQQVRPETLMVLSPRAASAALEQVTAAATALAPAAPTGEPTPVAPGAGATVSDRAPAPAASAPARAAAGRAR